MLSAAIPAVLAAMNPPAVVQSPIQRCSDPKPDSSRHPLAPSRPALSVGALLGNSTRFRPAFRHCFQSSQTFDRVPASSPRLQRVLVPTVQTAPLPLHYLGLSQFSCCRSLHI